VNSNLKGEKQMQPAQPPNHRNHTAVWLGILALLVIASTLIGACKTEPGPQPGVPSPSPSPQGSPGPTGSPVYLRGDTPIVVKGGGSIDLDFDDNAFTGMPKPMCANCRITKVELEQIKDTGQPIPPAPVLTQCPFTSAPTVTVETNGNQDDIAIKSTAGGVEIEFPGAQYPGVITECGDAKKHHSKNGVIKDVKVNGTSCAGCTGNWKRCKVVIHVF
jgi:hypothetical protein